MITTTHRRKSSTIPSLPSPRRWTRAEYHRAAELGLFRADERLELLQGEIVTKVAPQKSAHFSTIDYGADALTIAFGPGFYVRKQGPFLVSDESEPEPDLLVVVGNRENYIGRHPRVADVRLVVEVSDTTLRFDRTRKAALYAAANLPDYWILNVNNRTLEVRRDPALLPNSRNRWGYHVVTLTETQTVSPLAAPQSVVRVADLFPPIAPINTLQTTA